MKKSTINRELIRNIMLWIIENEEDVQIKNNCVNNFKDYIYNKNGDYWIGGEQIDNFIYEQIDLLKKY